MIGNERSKLKPCPFCNQLYGSELRLIIEPIKTYGFTRHAVECGRCGTVGPSCFTKRGAIKAWNMRGSYIHENRLYGEPIRSWDDVVQNDPCRTCVHYKSWLEECCECCEFLATNRRVKR